MKKLKRPKDKKFKLIYNDVCFIEDWNDFFIRKYYSKRGVKESKKGFG